MESYLIQYRQLTSTLCELIYHVMSLGLRKATGGGLLLAKVTFVHADLPSLIHQKQYAALGEKSILG